MKWSICAILYFACVIPMNLFDMFDKKETKDQKTHKQTNNTVTRKSYWMLCDEWIRSNQHYQYVPMNIADCVILSHSAKSCTIGILTSLGKIVISPDSNIQIGWNKRHSKAKTSFVTLSYVLCRNYFYLHQTRALFLRTIFSRTPCIMVNTEIIINLSSIVVPSD